MRRVKMTGFHILNSDKLPEPNYLESIYELEDPIAVGEYVVKLFLFISNRMRTLGNDVLQSENLTIKQYFLLEEMSKLGENDTFCKTDIAKRMGESRSNIRKMVDRLKNNGYVEVDFDTEDKRASCPRLTDEGYDVLQRCAPLFAEVLEIFFNNMGFDELCEVADSLGMLEEFLPKRETVG